MTISQTTSRWSYAGNGATDTFGFNNKIFAAANIQVYIRFSDGSAPELKTMGVHYTVTLNADTTGSVVFDPAHIPAADPDDPAFENVLLVRNVPETQTKTFPVVGAFPSEQVSEGFDKLTVLIQQHTAKFQGTFQLNAADDLVDMTLPLQALRANRAATYDADGKPSVSNHTVAQLEAGADTATEQAAIATAQAGIATTKADEAAADAADADVARIAAEAAAASTNLPAVVSGAYLRGNALETGWETRTPAELTEEIEALLTPPTPPGAQVFTASGTWNKPAGLVKVKVTVVGAGGGGGGTVNSGYSGAGGGGGGAAVKWIAAADLSATETVTVGASGAGGASGSNAGSSGGTSSFGAHCSATGGGGGGSGDLGSASGGGAGGVGSGGDVNLTGGGGASARTGSTVTGPAIGGAGAGQYGGGGGRANATLDGAAGGNYGGGGSGGGPSSGANRPGGAGAAGVVIIEEYFQ